MAEHIELICVMKTSAASFYEGKVRPVPAHIRKG